MARDFWGGHTAIWTRERGFGGFEIGFDFTRQRRQGEEKGFTAGTGAWTVLGATVLGIVERARRRINSVGRGER